MYVRYTVISDEGGANERDENEARGSSPRVPDPFIRCAGRYVAVSIDLDPRPQSGTIYSLFGHLNRPPHITTASTTPEHPSPQDVDVDDSGASRDSITYS